MFRQMGFKTSDESKAEPQTKFVPVMGFQGLLACGVRVMYNNIWSFRVMPL